MPLILVQNEITAGNKYDHWEDDEGVQYHFPNQYINKVKEGESFIYYRGSRRANNNRAVPEYFGCGKIGKVWLDPNSDIKAPRYTWHWYCEILDYFPFMMPIPFKRNGLPYEKIASNLWSVAVRNISVETYNDILREASIITSNEEIIIKPNSPLLPSLDEVKPVILDERHNLLTPYNKVDITTETISGLTNQYSKHSKLFGDRAEEIVYQVLIKERTYNLRWVAKENEKPGWDIEYRNNDERISVEVKGTSGKRFLSVDVTKREWEAAETHGENYKLYLVADCLSKTPKIQIISNPYGLYLSKRLSVTPINYRLRLLEP